MNRILPVALLIFTITGCASFMPSKIRTGNDTAMIPLPPYSGLKTRVVVADFDTKAAKATGETSAGLREMLVKALLNSNRFSVGEQKTLSAAPQDADLIISVAITEFEPQASGGSAGVGGGGANSSAFGGLLGVALNKAHMALEVRIIDTTTSGVLASTQVQGQASDVTGGIANGFGNNWALGGGLSVYANTPMEKAIRVCIIEAVCYIAGAVPKKYYKY